MNDVAAPVFAMGVNDPTPAISGNGAAITPMTSPGAHGACQQLMVWTLRRRFRKA
jgi:hypothetical protein